MYTFLAGLIGCASVPKLSKENKRTINEVLKAPLPKIIQGETGFAQSTGHQIWFERQKPKDSIKGSVLLIMGNGNDALTWPQSFIYPLVQQGYEVIRFDHRGTGLSTSEKKWNRKNHYTLNDMADDAVAILDTLGLEKVHIVGVSMGGMIAQIIAIDHPERTVSLTSIMSSGDVMDPNLPPMSQEIFPKMVSTVLKHGLFGNKKGQIKRQIVHRRILMGAATGDIDVKTMAETALYNLKERNGYRIIAARHHYKAIQLAGPRYEALSKLTIPALVIHGVQDPVMPISHSKKLVCLLPDADSLWVKNMGHDIPEAAIGEITDAMVLHFGKIPN
ncbi:alpha/beta hydrolase [Flavobacteriaceae bacterium TP-CH-4]|uniref:Alpha/beta hydrolase n=1 Tax=Pelagihabitans pacificus TaxID=2696054 RepID=A0A967EEF3_9FLAO|nr:alpha/beta hydrolase [Pelagihabitans pacificus]NHF60318.1 alpha/beta hydrolase [Pelagihabitans pacificus]